MNTINLSPPTVAATPSRRAAGVVLSVLATLFLLADAGSEVLAIPPVLAGAAHIGFPVSPAFWHAIGVVLLVAAVLYAIPRTALLGAIVATGYLGGAICAHVRMGEDVLVPTLVSLAVAVAMWAGLALREPRLANMILRR